MTAFHYKALNDQGKLVKGVLEGDSDRQVLGALRQRHLRPIEVVVATDTARLVATGDGNVVITASTALNDDTSGRVRILLSIKRINA